MVFVKVKIYSILRQNACITVLVVKVNLIHIFTLSKYSIFLFFIDRNSTYFVSEPFEPKYEYGSSTLAPIAPSDRGAELTFSESGYYTVFMMAENNAFIQLDGNRIPTFQLR